MSGDVSGFSRQAKNFIEYFKDIQNFTWNTLKMKWNRWILGGFFYYTAAIHVMYFSSIKENRLLNEIDEISFSLSLLHKLISI